MKKFKRLIIIFISTVLSAAFIIGVFVLLWAGDVFLPWTDVPKGISNVEELTDYCVSEVKKPVTLEFSDGNALVDTSDLLSVDADVRPLSFWDYIGGMRPPVYCSWEYSEDAIKETLAGYYRECEDAHIQMNDDGTFELVPEVLGREFDVNEVTRLFIESFRKQEFSINLVSKCKMPEVTEKDLQNTYNNIKWANSWYIEYDSGFRVDASLLKGCWDNRYVFNSDNFLIDSVIAKLEEDYNTSDNVLDFTSHDGIHMDIPYNTFGVRISKDKETEFIKNSLLNKETVRKREPFTYGYDSFGSTYIEVDLTKQHVWHYVDGRLCCESDCVTGTRDKHDTPTGVFYVSEKVNGKYLKGDGYKTWVNQWMRLTNQGVGLHDAYWRVRFGNSIYTYNGSHGCINLPKEYARNLYDEISTGIPVVVYDET